MEKYGIEIAEPETKDFEKYGEIKCDHPSGYIQKDREGVRFCAKCNKYLSTTRF
jgi:hypothetical protein